MWRAETPSGLRSRAARWLMVLVTAGMVAGGLVGTLAYLKNYDHHRGFTAVARLPSATPGRLQTVTFYSPALGHTSDYQVYMPTGYTSGRRYPVLYLLHGTPGADSGFTDFASAETRLDNLIKQGQVPPMLLVFPDGLLHGDPNSDAEWANTPSAAMESYVVDVVHDVDRRFPTVGGRGGRVLAGNSEGGYGAMNIALHHLDLFGAVQSWSGYFLQTRTGVFAGASRATIAYNSPLDYVRGLRSRLERFPLKVFIYSGARDPYSTQIRPMADALRAVGASVAYAIFRGGHDWELWNAHFDQMLILAGRDVQPGRAGSRSGRGASLRASRAPPPRSARKQVAGTLVRSRHRLARGGDPRRLIAGLVLALLSSVLVNFGFLLQHRGLVASQPSALGLKSRIALMIRNRAWLAGQALGCIGFALQIVAVAISLLSLVQAFAAGGLALSVPLAARVLGHRISRTQVLAVMLIAVSLALLPLGLPQRADSLRLTSLAVATSTLLVVAAVISIPRTPPARALASGLFYGAADVAIKTAFLTSAHHGSPALRLTWVAVALAATFGGFLALQSALRTGQAVAVISLMNAACAIAALGCGVIALGESLGRSPAVVGGHLVAVGLLLACVPVLAAAQNEMAEPGLAQPAEEGGRTGRGGKRASGGEQQRLDPHARSRTAGGEHGTNLQISRQRKRGLRAGRQQHRAEHRGEHAPLDARHAAEHKARYRAGGDPHEHEARGGLAVEAGQLEEG